MCLHTARGHSMPRAALPPQGHPRSRGDGADRSFASNASFDTSCYGSFLVCCCYYHAPREMCPQHRCWAQRSIGRRPGTGRRHGHDMMPCAVLPPCLSGACVLCGRGLTYSSHFILRGRDGAQALLAITTRMEEVMRSCQASTNRWTRVLRMKAPRPSTTLPRILTATWLYLRACYA